MSQPTSHPTINDVARHAGVSTATVSRVLNKLGNVRPATVARVEAAIQTLHYVPHNSARTLASNRTNTLGLLVPTISDFFFIDLLRGIEQAAYEHQYGLLIYATHQRPWPHIPPTLPINHLNTDGLIIFDNSLDDPSIRQLHQQQFPLLLLHRSPPTHTAVPSITFENQSGARQMVYHLLACGHRRIAFLAGPAHNQDAQEREAGYRQALSEQGLAIDPALIQPGEFDTATAQTAVTRWLQQATPIDAIFAADDNSARGALLALQAAHVAVPQQIAVVGFDDSFLSQYLQPPLTTMHAPIEQAGRTAVAHLIELIQTGHTAHLTRLPTQLIVRQSCGWHNKQAQTAHFSGESP